jgi:glutaredoxin
MNNYYIKAIMLENCPYSIAAGELLKTHNIPNKMIWITQNDKDKYVTDMISTYPQIYLKKYNNNQHLLLGGHDDLSNFISNFLSQKLTDTNLNTFSQKYNWSKKATLRLIQLINS